ncbi:MAG: uroporphyrinogen decarboxylase [Spirochaetales bacterium]|jgi:uroporphyrinogen decarboxylase|nr:uroporphyrinogen decarboxylase [Spirochaetales bacterium]
MTHRERVQIALNHQEPDRIPRDLGGRVSSMMEDAYNQLKAHLELDECGYDTVNQDWFTVEEIDERLLTNFDIDFRRIFLKGSSEYERIEKEDGTWTDELGFVRRFSGQYGEMVDHPLRHASTRQDIERFRFFDPLDPARAEGVKERSEYLFNDTDYALVAAGAVGGILETCCWFRGFDQFPVDLMVDKDLAHCLLEKYTCYCENLMDTFLNAAGKFLDVVEMADDLGSQSNLLISPDLYRDMILPYYQRLIRRVKAKTNAKIFHHSCGAVTKAGDILIDAGVDILNSLQPKAAGMNTTFLKDNFGNKLCFHGGIDIQDVLPNGTHEDVENEVRNRIAIWAPNGGYIFCAAHNIQADVPPENITAMYRSAQRWGAYPLDSELLGLRNACLPHVQE